VGFGEAGELELPTGIDADATIVIDELTQQIGTMLTAEAGTPGFYLSATEGTTDPSWRKLRVVPDHGSGSSHCVCPYVPVNSLAAQHRHNGFGFTGYLLVLAGPNGPTPEPVAWLSAAFHDANVILVSQAVASAWRGRSLRGQVTVDTQMDLWRLLAHACLCVDLEPGPLIARQCVEALRFGTPIAVPESSGPAAAHARAGGGFTFADAQELIEATSTMMNGSDRAVASARGREYADTAYGDPDASVTQVRALLVEPQTSESSETRGGQAKEKSSESSERFGL
jgi:hypothetical protein